MKKTVLVVDDAKTMRELVKAIRESEGYSVVTATDGVEGLALAREKNFDAAMVDLHMPNMNGMEMAQKIRELDAHQHTKTVFLTTEVNA